MSDLQCPQQAALYRPKSPEPAGPPPPLRVRHVPHRRRLRPQPGQARGPRDDLPLDRARGCFQCLDAGILDGKFR